MNFYYSIFYYGSPVVAALACLLNFPEIIFLVQRYRRTSKARSEHGTVPIILLISLAASDFLVGFTVILIKVLRRLLIEGTVPPSDTSDQVYKVLNFLFLRLSLLTSVLCLLALTLDRFLAIRRPIVYRTRIRTRHGIIAVLVTWFSSSLIISVHYYFSIFGGIEELKYRLLVFPVTIFPACVAFAVFYIMMLHSISVQARETIRISANKTKSYQRYVLERELKVSRFAATVVCVFMICWLPLAFTGLVMLCGVTFDTSLTNLVFFLAFVNSVIDPIIYFAFKDGFCLHFKRFVSTCFRWTNALRDRNYTDGSISS